MGLSVGITGYGRIGRLVLRACIERGVRVAAINSTVTPDYMAYMLKYDTVHGRFDHEIAHSDGKIIVDGMPITVFSNRNAGDVPWSETDVNYLIDSTGQFKSLDDASAHLRAGVKKVVVTAPTSDIPMLVMGVNHNTYESSMDIVSNASCTTNALAPVAKILNDKFGIASGLILTVHAATASQKVVDGKSQKDWRGGRAVSGNIIPSSTGAAEAVAKVIPELQGRLTGISMRVPTINVSVVDLTANLEKPVKYKDICAEMKRASENELRGILAYTEDEVVSSDFVHDPHISIFDAKAGVQISDTFVKVIAWYDNEWGYSQKVIDLITHMAKVDGNL